MESVLVNTIVNSLTIKEVRKVLSSVDPLVASHAINDAVKQLSGCLELYILAREEGKALYSLQFLEDLEDEAMRYERRANHITVFTGQVV